MASAHREAQTRFTQLPQSARYASLQVLIATGTLPCRTEGTRVSRRLSHGESCRSQSSGNTRSPNHSMAIWPVIQERR